MNKPTEIPTEKLATVSSIHDDNNDDDKDIGTQNQEPSVSDPVPEPSSPLKRTVTTLTKQSKSESSSKKKKSKKSSKESNKAILLSPKQHIDKGISKSRKQEKKDSSSLKKPPKEKLNAHDSTPMDPPKTASPAKKKKKKKTASEKAAAKKTAGASDFPDKASRRSGDQKRPPQKPNANNALQKGPSAQTSTNVENSIEKTRITTRAQSSSLASNTSRKATSTLPPDGGRNDNSKSGHRTLGGNESNNFDDGDNSVSTAPLPPSLRVQDHHSLRPGAYRMYTGGVARYVDSAGDDMDDDYSTSNFDQSTASYTDSRFPSTVDGAVTIEARLVEDEPPPPQFRQTPSAMAVASATPTGITYASVAIEEEDSSIEKDEDEGYFSKKRKMQFLVCFAVFSIIIIASIVAASALRRRRGKNSSANIGIDENELSDSMKAFIDALPQYTIASLAIDDSDQSKALDWMMTYDDLDSFPLDRQLQRFALITLFYATTSQDLSSEILTWLAGRDECEWYESVCVNDFYTELSLRAEYPLSGTIVPELALLTSLETLLVDENALVGTIPTELGYLTDLKKLGMNDNLFGGPIPTEFGKLSNLEDINLSSNILSGSIPTEIGSWESVERVMFANNTLEGTMPTQVGRMLRLVDFSVASNALDGQLPSSIVRLLRMETLNVERNYFRGRFLPEIESIGLEGFIGRVGSLKSLKLAHNEFTGTIATTIGLLKALEEFDVSKNNLKSHLPTEIGLLSSLTSLHLNGNELDDSLPVELAQLSNLEEMLLHQNLFTGTLPPEICQIPNLKRDDLTIDCARVFCLCCHCGPRNKDDQLDGNTKVPRPPPSNGGQGGQKSPPPPARSLR